MPLELLASDRFGFGDEFLTVVGREVVAVFSAVGVAASWSTVESTTGSGAGPEPYVIVFSAKPPEAWGVKRRAMGIVVPGERPRRRIVVFPERVLRVLDVDPGFGRPPAATFNPTTARALARVVAHELVHALIPDHAHAERGLMRGTLERRLLLGRELPFDGVCSVALASALGRPPSPLEMALGTEGVGAGHHRVGK